MLEGRPRSRCE